MNCRSLVVSVVWDWLMLFKAAIKKGSFLPKVPSKIKNLDEGFAARVGFSHELI